MRIEIKKGIVLELTNNDSITIEQLEKVKQALTSTEKVFIKIKDPQPHIQAIQGIRTPDTTPVPLTIPPPKTHTGRRGKYKRKNTRRNGEFWQKWEHDLVINTKQMTPTESKKLARQLERTPDAIRVRYHNYQQQQFINEGKSVLRYKSWTPSEDKILLQENPTTRTQERKVARMIGRTQKSVNMRFYRLREKQNQQRNTTPKKAGRPSTYTQEEDDYILRMKPTNKKTGAQVAHTLGRNTGGVIQRYYQIRNRTQDQQPDTFKRRHPKLPTTTPYTTPPMRPRISPLDDESTGLLMDMLRNVVFYEKKDLTYSQAQHLLRTSEGNYITIADWTTTITNLLKNKHLVLQEAGSDQYKIAMVGGIGVVRHK